MRSCIFQVAENAKKGIILTSKIGKMREILFRGIPVDGTEFIYGHFMIGLNNEYYIIHEVKIDDRSSKLDYTIVKPETVGQFTGLTDKNGVKIFEGDLTHLTIPVTGFENGLILPIIFIDGLFGVTFAGKNLENDRHRECKNNRKHSPK